MGLFTSKKQKTYAAFELISDYIRSNFQILLYRLFVPNDDEGALCSMAATVVYLGILFGGSAAHYDLYRLNYQDQPTLQAQLDKAVNDMIDYTEIDAAQTYYKQLYRPDHVARLVDDPYNEILDRQYGKLIYAVQYFADEYGALYRDDIDLADIKDILYDYFVSHESSAKPLVNKIRNLLT